MYKIVALIMTVLGASVVIVICSIFFISVNGQFASITIDIPGQGAVLGNYDVTAWTSQTYIQFRGIPYAESPSGKLRFKPPVSRLPWRHILNATKYGRRCPVITTISQLTNEELKQDVEDCLSLCVYTKNITARNPVMLYIYGGGYYNGSSSDHPPQYLLEKDIVLVVPQYRIGALGWLTTNTEEMPGNAPIADILLALEWVSKYIHAFGGDPKQVTIFGQSAGAGVAGALLLSPKTPVDAFKHVIVQSGSIFANWAMDKTPFDKATSICEKLQCQNCTNSEQMHQCFGNATVLEILQVTKSDSFSPIIGDFHGILPKHPNKLINSYDREIPIMTGFTKHDGSFILATYYDSMKEAVGNLSYVTVQQFMRGLMDMADDDSGMVEQFVTRLLFLERTELLGSNEHKLAIPSYFDLTTDLFMKSPIMQLASKFYQKQTAPIFLYSFDYEGEHTRFGYEMGNSHYPFNGGAHHSNDNLYLFPFYELNEEDTMMAKRMVELWTSFAINGVPSYDEGFIEMPHMLNEYGPYFHIAERVTFSNDVLMELTSTIDDPDNYKLIRLDIEF